MTPLLLVFTVIVLLSSSLRSSQQERCYFYGTGAWSSIDTLANCNKAEYDKI